MASQYHANIEVPLLTANSKCGNMLEQISQIRRLIDSTRDENLDLERMRDQYIIHLQQCQEDHDTLRGLYKSLKLKLDRTLTTDSEPQFNSSTVPVVPSPVQQQVPPSRTHIERKDNIAYKKTCDLGYDVKQKFGYHIQGILCSVTYNLDGSQIAFSNGQTLFIISSTDGSIIIQSDLPTNINDDDAHCRSIAFSPAGDYVALAGSYDEVYLAKIEENGIQYLTLKGHTKEVSSILFNEEGKELISGGFDGSIIIWDVATGKEINRIANENCIVGISAASDYSFFAVAFTNGKVKAYSNIFDNPITFSAHPNAMMAVAISPFDDHIATAAQDGTVSIWLIRVAARNVKTLSGHSDFALATSFSRSKRLLVTGSKDQTVRLWDYMNGREVAMISAHDNTVFGVCHHPTRDEFVSVGGDGNLYVWTY